MQNRTFLVLLWPIFGEKLKTAPPPKEIGLRSCEVHVVIRSEKALEYPTLAERAVSISLKTFFFGDHLFMGGKTFEFPSLEINGSESGDQLEINVRITELSEKFRLNFRTNRVILIQE